jgi:hypothetical protein
VGFLQVTSLFSFCLVPSCRRFCQPLVQHAFTIIEINRK